MARADDAARLAPARQLFERFADVVLHVVGVEHRRELLLETCTMPTTGSAVLHAVLSYAVAEMKQVVVYHRRTNARWTEPTTRQQHQ